MIPSVYIYRTVTTAHWPILSVRLSDDRRLSGASNEMRLRFRDYNSTVFDAFTTNSNLTKEYISLYSLHKTKGTKGACIYKGDYIIISALRYTYILVAKDLYYKQILPHESYKVSHTR